MRPSAKRYPMVEININPVEGLKLAAFNRLAHTRHVEININPVEGLKLTIPAHTHSVTVRRNQHQPSRGIETTMMTTKT